MEARVGRERSEIRAAGRFLSKLAPLFLALLALSCGIVRSSASVTLESKAPIVAGGRLTEAIGIETLGGVFSPLLPTGTRVPMRSTEMFSTGADDQREIKVRVYRGNAERVADARAFPVATITGLAPRPRGKTQISVTVSVAADGTIAFLAASYDAADRLAIRLDPPAAAPRIR
jgi:molecular chaperone DnaK